LIAQNTTELQSSSTYINSVVQNTTEKIPRKKTGDHGFRKIALRPRSLRQQSRSLKVRLHKAFLLSTIATSIHQTSGCPEGGALGALPWKGGFGRDRNALVHVNFYNGNVPFAGKVHEHSVNLYQWSENIDQIVHNNYANITCVQQHTLADEVGH
jgi:hypothetical protein